MAYRARRQLSSSVQAEKDETEECQKRSRPRRSRLSSQTDNLVSRRGLATSVTAFISRLRPSSKHPERGLLTHDDNGVQSDGPGEVKGETTSRYTSDNGEVHESDIIPAEYWNTPIPIPCRTHSLSSTSRVLRRPLPISAGRSRQSLNTNGLTLDGESSAPPRRSSTRASDLSQRRFLAKQEARRQRQNLKESGDFLGVTGFNPQTGELDSLTPTTSSGEGSPNENQHLAELAAKAKEAQAAYERAKNEARGKKKELKGTGKYAAHLEQHHIKWRREERQWSSAAETRLSPIPQSRTSSGAAQTNDSTTVKAAHVSFLEPGTTPQPAETARCRQASRGTTECQTPLGTKSSNSQPIPQDKSEVPVKSCMRQARTVRPTIPPIIPHRLGPSQRDTSTSLMDESASEEKDIKLGLENKNPAERWAHRLLQDLDGLEKSIETNKTEMKAWTGSIVQDIGGLGTAVGSACTPTTTITGSEQRLQPSKACGEKDTTLQDTLPKAASTSAPTRSLPSETPKNENSCSSPLASPPLKQPSASSSLPNLSLQTAAEPTSKGTAVKEEETREPKEEASSRLPSPSSGPAADTTLPLPDTAKNALERPFHVAWMTKSHHPKKEMRKTMRANEDHQSAPVDNKLPPTSTSTESPDPSSNSTSTSATKPKLGDGQRDLNQAMVQGAARLAFTPHVPQPAPETGLVSGPMDDKVNHGVEEDTGVADQAGTSSGDGGDRGAAKTVMAAEAGHDDGHADLAGTVSWGPLLTALFGVPSADNDYIQNGNWLMVIGVQPQQTEENSDNQQPLPLPIHGDMVLLPEAAQEPQDGAWDDWMPVRLRKVVSMFRRLVSAYWDLVRPAFDADSSLRQRLEQRQQVTVQDYGICILALLFLILAGSAGAWTIRIAMEVLRLIGVLTRMILRVILALAGLV